MSEISVPPDDFRSGFVTLVGRPNAGKSTLLNKILGQKVSIVSDKPQTTRTQVRGVLTSDTHQIVFVDTPGIHKPRIACTNILISDITRRQWQRIVRAICLDLDDLGGRNQVTTYGVWCVCV